MYPLRLTPSWREKIWGSTNLEPLFGPQDRRIGEAWYTFEENSVSNGPWAGQTIAELMAREGAALMGTAYRPTALRRRSPGEATQSAAQTPGAYFPILVKFLFTSDKLSVQVHPDDAYAFQHEDGPGKTEMWYVLRADPGAAIALGLTESLTREELRQAAVSGDIVRYLNWVQVQPGDAVFSPPGTLHSIGGGLALCEIQQNSDLTYRFYDFGRLVDDGKPRALHIDQAVAVTRLEPYEWLQTPAPFQQGDLRGETLAVCDHFAAEKLICSAPLHYQPDAARMHLLIFIQGRGLLGEQSYRPGDVYLIPAAMQPFDFCPAQPTICLRSYVP